MKNGELQLDQGSLQAGKLHSLQQAMDALVETSELAAYSDPFVCFCAVAVAGNDKAVQPATEQAFDILFSQAIAVGV